MGKHERQEAKEAEIIIVNILNSQKPNSFDKENHWFKHALALAEQIKKDFPRISLATHLGNRYDNTGDILVVSGGKNIFIEIKMSDTRSGVGTKAGISQDALTENGLFVGKIKNWSQFRKERKHEQWVDKYLSGFNGYPKTILAISNETIKREEKARHLRKLKLKGDKNAEMVLADIQKKDRAEKIAYSSYLAHQNQQEEMIRRFFILIMLGIHRKEELKNLINNTNFFQEAENLFVYYGNFVGDKVNIRKEDVGERIKKILSIFPNFKIIFPVNSTNCKIMGVKKENVTPLLQVVFHWKNIAQGIKTPCLNIFDLTIKLI